MYIVFLLGDQRSEDNIGADKAAFLDGVGDALIDIRLVRTWLRFLDRVDPNRCTYAEIAQGSAIDGRDSAAQISTVLSAARRVALYIENA